MSRRPVSTWRKVVVSIMCVGLALAAGLLSVFVAHRPMFVWRLFVVQGTPPKSLPRWERFNTMPPGARLPSEKECAQRVLRSSWEPRPENTAANRRVPTAEQIAQVAPWGSAMGVDPRADALRKQITGDFTGTTDDILQWVACKWGIDEDIVRAEAVVESDWEQSQVGDWTTKRNFCPPGTWNGQGCYQSYGILQIKYYYFQGTWPMSRDDTAFNAEYMYGVVRTCFEGWTTYLLGRVPVAGYPRYHAGDLWGCIGRWYSGGWYDRKAIEYIAKVKMSLAQKSWLEAGF